MLNQNLNQELEQNKYLVVRNFVSDEIIDLADCYYRIKFLVQRDSMAQLGKYTMDKADIVQPCSVYSYADSFTETLLAKYRNDMREITGVKNLEPSYSLTRFYEKHQFLGRHIDRPSCQYSITLPLVRFDDTPWIIYCDDNPIDLNIGDMLIYKGCEAEHWREPYEGEWQVQAHLHYIDNDSPVYRPFYLDGRTKLGEKRE